MFDVTSKVCWETAHTEDLNTYLASGICGEEWFGDEGYKSIEWLNKYITEKSKSILDLGCGNAVYLMKLSDYGFTNLFGIDYVNSAIQLAIKLAENEVAKPEKTNLSFTFSNINIMNVSQNSSFEKKDTLLSTDYDSIKVLSASKFLEYDFDVIHDKGTFDIYYMKNQCDEYIQKVIEHFAKKGTIICVTSCNTTEDELIDIWTTTSCSLKNGKVVTPKLIDKIDYPKFEFNGILGQQICTTLFEL